MKPISLLLFFLHAEFSAVSQAVSKPTEIPIEQAASITIHIPGVPDFLAADGEAMWILNTDKVEKFLPASDKPVFSIPVPGACGAMAIGFRSIWVVSCSKQAVYRIDKQSGKILAVIATSIADPDGEISIAAGDDAVWVPADSNGLLNRIDPVSNTVSAKIKVLAGSYCAVAGYGSIWISNTKNNSVQRIDPVRRKVIATIAVGKTPRFLSAGENGIWTLNQGDGTVSHLDPASNKMVASINTNVPGTGGDIDAGGGHVWVRTKGGHCLQTINPRTNQVETIYINNVGSGGVRAAKKFIWVTAHDINTVWLIKR